MIQGEPASEQEKQEGVHAVPCKAERHPDAVVEHYEEQHVPADGRHHNPPRGPIRSVHFPHVHRRRPSDGNQKTTRPHHQRDRSDIPRDQAVQVPPSEGLLHESRRRYVVIVEFAEERKDLRRDLRVCDPNDGRTRRRRQGELGYHPKTTGGIGGAWTVAA
ncbi:hypothetical protein LBMAG47_21740 [Planctomycetia bacterium]|nr:hypothetical protein LBMAG47_21740 [Planctomycetia bacterium]